MKLLSRPSELQNGPRKVCAAIGMFDGVHLGHQQVIRQTLFDARQHNAIPVVITFDRHPNSVVAPAKAPLLIYSSPVKLTTIEQLGIEAILELKFTLEFSRQSGEQFVRDLVSGFGQVHSVCVGKNFSFGHKRSGNVETLARLGTELNFSVHGLSAVSLGGRIVSSTRIRELIAQGDLDQASQCLGRNYTLNGIVEKGDQLGRKMGIPTANLNVTGLVTPPRGVYAVQARVHGRIYQGVTNIGLRPTLANPEPSLRVETHLFDFLGEIYDAEMEITFVARLRDEQKFPSLEALQTQIALDIRQAKKLLD